MLPTLDAVVFLPENRSLRSPLGEHAPGDTAEERCVVFGGIVVAVKAAGPRP